MFQFTTPAHPVGPSRNRNPPIITLNGIEDRPAPAANNAPFLIQVKARSPSYVRLPSEFTSELHEE
jgi:hypothetical protein